MVFFALVLLRGWVIWSLWGWFVVPLGVREIGMAHAIGISLTVGTLAHQRRKSEDSRWFGEWIGSAIAQAVLTIGIGWIIHSWMV